MEYICETCSCGVGNIIKLVKGNLIYYKCKVCFNGWLERNSKEWTDRFEVSSHTKGQGEREMKKLYSWIAFNKKGNTIKCDSLYCETAEQAKKAAYKEVGLSNNIEIRVNAIVESE